MRLTELYQHYFGAPATGARPGHAAARRRRRRPSLEQLEARTVLSSFTAKTVSDLIADIHAANQAGGSNTITLVAPTTSPYILTAVDNTTDGPTGLPVIAASDSLTIVGNGDTIERGTAPAFRLLDVAAGASLTLRNLTVQAGLASGAGVSAEGGAVFNHGTLDLNGVTVQNNAAQGQGWTAQGAGQSAAGGGIYSGGAVTLEGGTTVQKNQALGLHGAPARGSPVHVLPAGPGGNGSGGGVYVAGGTVRVTGATIYANTAEGGVGGAGACCGPGTANGPGGNGSGGGMYVAGGTVTVTDATLSANSAQGGLRGPGNGVASCGDGFGGGLYAAGGTVTMRGDNVTNNSAQVGDRMNPGVGVGVGGGLYIDPAATVYLDTFTQAHVTHNTAYNGDPNIHGPWKPC